MISLGTVPEWFTAITAVGSLKYLIDYAKAAREQVIASQAQVRISERQVEISQEQIVVSQEQVRLSQAQVELTERHTREQMRPILVMSALERTEDGAVRFTIQNQGGGAAFDIRWDRVCGAVPVQQFGSQTFVLGPGAAFTATLQADAAAELVFVYHSTFGEELRSEMSVLAEVFSTRYYPHAGDRSERVE